MKNFNYNNFGIGKTAAVISFAFAIGSQLLCVSSAFGTTDTRADINPASSGAVYHIQPDDVLTITVLGQDDLTKAVTVLSDGSISYPCLGSAHVAGMTLPQLQTKLVSAISSQLVNPQVSVGVETAHVSDISVLGAVKEPGKLPMKQGWHVLDALAASGGLTVDKPEYVSATLVRSGSQMIPIDVAQLLDGSPEKSSEMNLALVPGDVLLVEAKDPSITEVQVLGDVAHPGYWPASPTGSVSAVLSEAGGSNLDAALSNATLIHDGTSTNVDLSQILVNGTVASNVSLQPGDTLVIPQNKRWFAVYGAVQKPGYTPYPDGQNLNVFTALSLAGGQTQDADLSKASLVTVVNGQASKITHLDLQALIQRGDSTQNVSIPSDSILYIPNKNDKSHFKAEDLYPITALLNVIHL